MTTFKDLGVHGNYIKALKELQIKVPTEIQEKTIPVLLKTKTDYIGLAQTGTGKTAAYGLPILNSIDTNSAVVQALILSPTRELVQQIKKQLFKFTKFNEEKIFVEAVYGGEKIDKQMQRLQRPTHIIVATPGRLIDLIEKGNVNLRSIKTVVLDEADEMLSMGFKKELDAILNYTSGSRNTWLFSATMPEEILRIISKYIVLFICFYFLIYFVNVFVWCYNNVIFSFQGNRNPFIDNPYLATLIWNGPISEDLWGLLSTPDLDFKSVFIHPTIAQDYVYVEGLEVSKNAIQIYNQLGQKLEFELEGNKIDVSSLSKGMYLIQIQDRNQTKLFKFLVY